MDQIGQAECEQVTCKEYADEIVQGFMGDEFLVRAGNGIGVLIRDFQTLDDWLPIQGKCFDLISGDRQPEAKM